MQDLNGRPVCHRAEDLVTYLYGEAGESDARDFRAHLQQCDACRSEFAAFDQMHESILVWRNDALGASFTPATRRHGNPRRFCSDHCRMLAWAARQNGERVA